MRNLPARANWWYWYYSTIEEAMGFLHDHAMQERLANMTDEEWAAMCKARERVQQSNARIAKAWADRDPAELRRQMEELLDHQQRELIDDRAEAEA